MDYKKEYQGLVNVVREIYPDMTDYQKEKISGVCPELKESEDGKIIERIKKAVVDYWSDEPLDEILDWLEKQKNVHIPWYDSQKAKAAGLTILNNKDYDNLIKLKEWSEEDERIRNCLIEDCKETLEKLRNDKYGHQEIVSDLKEGQRERIKWLENLNSRSHWKPSKQHMTDLEYIIKYYPNIRGMVESIYNELKKLQL